MNNLNTFFRFFAEETPTFWESFGPAIVTVAVAIIAAVLFAFGIDRKENSSFNTKVIVYAAVAVALSAVLNFTVLFRMPNGGSITICRILPLLVFSYCFGFKKGVIVGAIYGLVDFLCSPVFIHPVQFLLDYPLAFATTGFAGLFRKLPKMQAFSFILGTVLTGFGRLAFSTASGVLYWETPFWGSVAYNSVLLLDTAVCLVAVIFLQYSNSFKFLLTKLSAAANQGSEHPEE